MEQRVLPMFVADVDTSSGEDCTEAIVEGVEEETMTFAGSQREQRYVIHLV